MVTLAATLIALFLGAVGFGANFYLFSQWLVHPRMRHRFRGGRPYVIAGWCLYLLGGSALRPLGRDLHSEVLVGLGPVLAIVGLGLIVGAAFRLLRANAGERRRARAARMALASEGTWPPPPDVPAD